MPESLALALALPCSLCGMAWLALAMEPHWRDARDADAGPARATSLRLRVAAALAFAASLGLCLVADHASIAVLVWIMQLVVAAALVAFTLAWRPRWLAWLAGPARRA